MHFRPASATVSAFSMRRAPYNRQTKAFLSGENVIGFLVGVSLVGLFFVTSRIGNGAKGTNHKNIARKRSGVSQQQMVFFEQPAFDFGTVLQKQTIHHAFRLVNKATNEMHIVGLRSSCSCTILDEKLIRMSIPPKDSLMIPVEFHSDFSEGPVSSAVQVFLETEGKRYIVRAQMQGQVNADFTIVPRSLDFGTLEPGQKATQSVRILRGALKGITITGPRVSASPFEVSSITNRAGFSTAELGEIAVTFVAPMARSSQVFDGVVDFETSSTRVPRATIPVSATVIPEIVTVPETIVLPRPEKSGESRITIQTLQPSRIVRVRVIADGVPQELQFAGNINNPDEGDSWGLKHLRRINNASLVKAKRVDFELEVRNGTGRNEARSASVQIRSL